MAATLRRWWWAPAGVVVAAVIAGSFGSGWAWALVAAYTAVNLLGTVMIMQEVAEQAEERGWREGLVQLPFEIAFVLQLPVGVVVVLLGGV